MRELYRGDNLELLRQMPTDSVDLIYLDPPFNSNKTYSLRKRREDNQTLAPESNGMAFEDAWNWDAQAQSALEALERAPHPELTPVLRVLGTPTEGPLRAYLVMMAGRLLELHRVLRPTGSLYLHCDISASHYLKLLLDGVFGPEQFRNEIIWHYYNKYSRGKRLFARNFDQILFYTKTENYPFTPLREARTEPVRQLLRENVNGVLKNRKGPDGKVMYRTVEDRKVDAVWKIPCLQPASKEMLGFPTQKPLALLERIVRASSEPGAVVLDPFCGSGTTLHAAELHGRGWIGIDLSPQAIAATETRLRRAFPELPFTTHDAGK